MSNKPDYEVKSKTLEVQQQELIKDLEAQVKTGSVTNRGQYEAYLRNIISELKEKSTPITKPLTLETNGIIDSKRLTEFFRRLSVDIRAAFREADETRGILNQRLGLSKSFYNDLQHRTKELEKALTDKRRRVRGVFAKSRDVFNESFTSASGIMLSDASIEGKNGRLALTPLTTDIANDPEDISAVRITRIPDDNKRGGVLVVSMPDRDIEENYGSGDRTMLQKGYWEERVITDGVPNLYYNNRRRAGVIVEMEIVFESNKEINYIQIDSAGKFGSEVLSVQYKTSKAGNWSFVTLGGSAIFGAGSDSIEFFNIDPINPRVLKFTFFQRNYTKISRSIPEYAEMTAKIKEDMTYDRYYGKALTDRETDYGLVPGSKMDSLEGNLYEDTISALESQVGREALMKVMEEVTNPSKTKVKIEINRKNLYVVGAHSIDLKKMKYDADQQGTYYSHDRQDKREVYGGGLQTVAVSLDSDESTPRGSTAQYWITNDNDTLRIPVVPVQKSTVREPCYFITSQYNNQLAVQLTFPLARTYATEGYTDIDLYKNGTLVTLPQTQQIRPGITPSSRQIWFANVTFDNTSVYSVEYAPERTTACTAWIIDPGETPGTADCETDSETMIFNTHHLAQTQIETHGTGCTCRPRATYIRVDEWNTWGLDSGTGHGYSAGNPTKPPIPQPMRIKEKF